jgi:limonene-1,2-epoxide hydrolase
MATTEAERIVNRFVAAWERGDPEELLAYFAEDAVWHPIPMKAAVGKDAVRKAISEWLNATNPIRGEIHLQVSDGKVVMHERTDWFSLRGQEHATRVAAVFEIDKGRIAAWREYFDMASA